MKYQLLLLSLVTTIMGASSFGNRSSVAEPAPLFQPIIREIKDRLPANFQMRLPTVLPEFTKDLELYAFIADDDLQIVNLGDKTVFSVLVADVPDCQQEEDPEACIVGVISVSEALSELPLQPEDLPDNIEDLTPVTLAESATGFYFTQDNEIQLVIWEQDRLGYLLFTEKCDDGCVSKQQMIDMARSAANEPAIYSLN